MGIGIDIKSDLKLEPKRKEVYKFRIWDRNLKKGMCILGCVNFIPLKTFNSVDIVLKMHVAYGIYHKKFFKMAHR